MGLRWRLTIALIVFLLSLVYALPSVPGIGTALERVLPSNRINLGLDLKGGIHLTLGVDVAKAVTNTLALDGQDLLRQAQDEKIVILRPRVIGGSTLEFVLPRAENETKLKEILARYFPQLEVDTPAPTGSGQLRYTARFSAAEIKRLEDMALDQALRTIRNRIDQFGVAEPDIRKQAGNRIQVQLPGISDPSRAVELIGRTAHLQFHLVRDDVDPYKSALPPGVVSLPLLEDGKENTKAGSEARIAVERDAMLTGEDVADARPSFDQLNQATVALSFNARGARRFEEVTAENVGRRMAIVLDGKVYSAPVIRERIGGGRASISGSFTTDEAQDLAIVLRAGSLPAPVSILEERTVGPSLGQESIDSGIRAAMVGGAAVLLFMGIYYGVSGIIANLMLCFTMLMIMAGMGAFGATLTLPGIAGIVLTIGMAV
ncbi:MAG: protein translocase subunit SecD, partial [Desulfovibrionaceae bacterium]|nr:protein translocase subunit SecD [Desulfovibrionaceae bacterium]